jgi:hypothetical protein
MFMSEQRRMKGELEKVQERPSSSKQMVSGFSELMNHFRRIASGRRKQGRCGGARETNRPKAEF